MSEVHDQKQKDTAAGNLETGDDGELEAMRWSIVFWLTAGGGLVLWEWEGLMWAFLVCFALRLRQTPTGISGYHLTKSISKHPHQLTYEVLRQGQSGLLILMSQAFRP